MRSISQKVQTKEGDFFWGGGGGTKLCQPFLVSCNISMMVTITISAIHQSWFTRTVQPHNASTIHAFPLAIFHLAIGESPLKFFCEVGPW